MNDTEAKAGDGALRQNIVMLHTMLQLLIAKGVFSKEEYTAAYNWFDENLNNLGRMAKEMAYAEPTPTEPSKAIIEQIEKIQQRLFGGVL